MRHVIKIENLNKTYDKLKAVDNFSFEVEPSVCFGLLGPNGAGKSTTMKMIYGKTNFDKNNNTKIDIFGFNPKKNSLEIKALAGIVPQENNLDNELNVFQNLYIYSKFYGISKKNAICKIDELLEFMELKEKKKAPVRSLSGGMQRRLVIARALLNSPKLLILDEPTTGLDPQVRHLIWNKLRSLKKHGTTILLTTHYMEEAFQICDKIIIMDKGKKILEGLPKPLLNENIEEFVMEVPLKSNISKLTNKNISNKKDIRTEKHMDTMFIYSDDIAVLKEISNSSENLEHYIRQSNLEDIFLKVTGRSLNEMQ